MPRRKKSKMKEEEEDQDISQRIWEKEESLKNLLNPVESYIMWLQSVLVWEKPYYSAALFLAVNVLFWFATTTRLYHLVGILGMTVVFVDMWTNYIWPEIKVPLGDGADTEDWTPVHPHLMSVPEISSYLAHWWIHVGSYVNWVVNMRKESHSKFFLLSIVCLSATTAVGHYVPGIYLSYFTVMGLFLFPFIIYHNIPQKVYDYVYPVVLKARLKVEARANVKRTRSKKGRGKKRESESPRAESPTISLMSHISDEDDSDQSFEEFVPSLNSMLTGALSKAAREGAEEEESTGHTPVMGLTPQTQSANHSEDESNTDDLPSFSVSVDEMPSINDIDGSLSYLGDSMPSIDDIDRSLSYLGDSTDSSPIGVDKNVIFDPDATLCDDDDDDSLLPTDLEKDILETDKNKNNDDILEKDNHDDENLSLMDDDVSDTGITNESQRHTGIEEDKNNDVIHPSLSEDDIEKIVETRQAETMHFISSHFKEPSSSEDDELSLDESLAQGLDFPDIEEELAKYEQEGGEPGSGILGRGQALGQAAGAAVQQTVTSLMASTISGFNKLSETVSRRSQTPTDTTTQVSSGSTVEYRKDSESDDGGIVTMETETQQARDNVDVDVKDSLDSIDAEFEFLDEQELEEEEVEPPRE